MYHLVTIADIRGSLGTKVILDMQVAARGVALKMLYRTYRVWPYGLSRPSWKCRLYVRLVRFHEPDRERREDRVMSGECCVVREVVQWLLRTSASIDIYLLIHLMPYHIISYHIIWHGMSSYEYILFEFTDKYSVIVNLTMLRKALSNSSSSSVARMRSSMRAASLSDNSSSCNTVQQAMEAQEWGSCKDREEGGGERGGWRERGGG